MKIWKKTMKKNTTKNSLVSKDHSNNSNRQYTGMGLTREKNTGKHILV